MDYQKQYNSLIQKSRIRNVEGYTEKHHIVPRCLGGSNKKENIAELTPEEHYVAHQLLVKMYPDNQRLIYALNMMTGRPGNKRYGWIKRRHQTVCKQRTGSKNGSYGRSWYYDPETLDNRKCLPEEVPEGYVKGRILEASSKFCLDCEKNLGPANKTRAKYCKSCRNKRNKNRTSYYDLSIKAGEEEIIDQLYKSKSYTDCIKSLNMSVSGSSMKRVKKIAKDNGIFL